MASILIESDDVLLQKGLKVLSLLSVVIIGVLGCQTSSSQVGFGQESEQLISNPHHAKITDTYAHPVIAINTSLGVIYAELFEDKTPNTVANIIVLAESGFYDDLAFHRILKGFMAQCGCPYSHANHSGGDSVGSGGPGYRISEEYDPELKHIAGCLNMAKTSEPNTTGSQFCLFFEDAPHLDGHHTVFGRVIDGWDVMEQLEAVGAERDPNPPTQVVRFSVRVVSKNNHVYRVKKFES